MTHHGFAQISFGISPGNTGIYGIVEKTAGNVDFLSDFKEHDRDTGILTQSHTLLCSYPVILQDILKYGAGQLVVLTLQALPNQLCYIIW